MVISKFRWTPPCRMNEVVDVAIIGSGPAGISAALELRRSGVRHVVILERAREAGGVPRHCAHPPYGFFEFGRIMSGPAYARRLVALAQQVGVDIRTLHTVVDLGPGGVLDVATPEGRRDLHAHRVLLATGVREMPRAARLLSGERPVGVINTGALQAYIHLHGMVPFRRPVILGTELVSLSAIADCWLHGIRPVAVIEANNRPTARWPLNLLPRILGIPVHLNSELAAIMGAPRVSAVRVSGPQNAATQEIACDGVLLTGDFVPEASLIRGSHLTLDNFSQGPALDQFGRCSDPSYFAAGNIMRPVETAGWCFREGRRIARSIVDDLGGRLPKAGDDIDVICGRGIKFVVPQNLVVASGPGGARYLEIRVASAVSGRLRVLTGRQKVLFEKTISALPERRILIPLQGFAARAEGNKIVVEIEA